MKKNRLLLPAVLCAMLALPFSTQAEEKNEEKTYYLDPITVTAEKTEQDAQKVPASVNAYTERMLEEQHITRLYDLTNYVPNLFLRKNSYENMITIRGVGGFEGQVFSPAGVYVDGINYPIHQMQNLDFMDIERVEVLKGPQGTLYGRNSEAGVINVITRQPDSDFGGKIYGEAGMWDTDAAKPLFKEGASFNLPLVEDTLAARVSIQNYSTDGWMENLSGPDTAARAQHFNARGNVRWTPTEDWDVSFILEGQHYNDGVGVYRFIDGPFATGRNELSWDGANKSDIDADAEILKIKYSAPSFDVTSVTGRFHYKQDTVNDFDMTPISMPMMENSSIGYDVTVWSEELRVASKQEKGKAFDWLAGVYIYHEDVDVDVTYADMQNTDQTDKGAAFFAQGTAHFLDRLHLTLGGRIEYAHLQADKDIEQLFPGMPRNSFGETLSYTEFLPSATLAFDLTPEIMSYARVAKGYLSGGFNYAFATTKDRFTYDPEYIWSYEIGLKSKWLDDRLMVNISAFYNDIEDKQVIELIGAPNNRNVLNAAKARSYGVEFDMRYKPVPGLTLMASAGYLNSKLEDWESGGVNFDGNTSPGAPEFSYMAGVNYRWESGFVVGANVTGVSSFYSDIKNELNNDGYALVNAQAGYEGENIDVMIWAKNIFNANYNDRSMNWGGTTLVQQGEPRSFGVQAAYRF